MQAEQSSKRRRSLGLDEYESDNEKDEMPTIMSEPSPSKRPRTRYADSDRRFPTIGELPGLQSYRTMDENDSHYERINYIMRPSKPPALPLLQGKLPPLPPQRSRSNFFDHRTNWSIPPPDRSDLPLLKQVPPLSLPELIPSQRLRMQETGPSYDYTVSSTQLEERQNLPAFMRMRWKESDPSGERVDSSIPPANGKNCLAKLSDELLVRILKSLDLKQVLECRFVNKNWRELASDGEVWRSLYFENFVSEKKTWSFENQKPGLEVSKRRIKIKQKAEEEKWAKKEMEWVDEMKKEAGEGRYKEDGISNNVQDRTNWLGKYRLRFNWQGGRAKRTTINLKSPTSPGRKDSQALSQMHSNMLYTADKDHGLRAWDLSFQVTSPLGTPSFTSWPGYVSRLVDDGKEPAQAPLHSAPTAMAIDISSGETRLAIGFEDGTWELWCHEDQARLNKICVSSKGSLGSILNIAVHDKYLTIITSHQLFLLYDIKPMRDDKAAPLQGTVLHDLTAYTAWAPYALSIHPTPSAIVASIAYTIPTVTRFSVSIHEMHFDPETGCIIDSRQASPLQPVTLNGAHPRNTGLSPPRLNTSAAREGSNATMTYNYPSLLVGRENNTLVNYQVTSTSSGLGIMVGRDLQPRTSGVMGVDIGCEDRVVTVQKGGAVSVTVLEKQKGLAWDKERTVVVDSGGGDVSATGWDVDEGRWEKVFVKSDDHKIVVVGGGRILICDFR